MATAFCTFGLGAFAVAVALAVQAPVYVIMAALLPGAVLSWTMVAGLSPNPRSSCWSPLKPVGVV
ncbi:hypothetical protein ACOBQB_33615 [Streptomyces sp. G5(2025)]|uniref:hypothetical protein n=1 Tax=Streptomyces sp. G5(2025) TaxID=3406628 RepID=UPI003C17999D